MPDTTARERTPRPPAVPGPWVVLGCGKQKRSVAAPALEMYTSSYFTLASRWAQSVTTVNRIVIMSAKHGLVPATTRIEPYDVTFRSTRVVVAGAEVSDQAVSQETLGRQASDLGLAGPVITIAGLLYRGRLQRATSGLVVPFNPFVELLREHDVKPGMFSQMGQMSRWTGLIPTPGDPLA